MKIGRIDQDKFSTFLASFLVVFSKPKLLLVFFILIAVVAAAVWFFFTQYEMAQQLLEAPKVSKQKFVEQKSTVIKKSPKKIDVASSQAEPMQVTKAPEKVSVAVYNGTKVKGLAAKGQKAIERKFPDEVVIDKIGNSADDYASSIVVDLTEDHADFAKKLATFVTGKIVSLPDGEVLPKGIDLLVILGEDYQESK